VTDGGQVALNRSLVNVDVGEFNSLLRSRSPDSDTSDLEAAADLYRGSFLEGFNLGSCPEFDDWQDAVRERLQLEFDELLETLITCYLEMGQPKRALPFARQWLELDPLNEAAHRALMEIYVRTGRTHLARKQFESCAQLLAREGIEPADRTRKLNDAIARDQVTPSAEPEDATVADRTSLPEKTGRAWRLRTRIVLGGAAVLAAAAIVFGIVSGSRPGTSHLTVTGLEPRLSGDELSGVRIDFRNEGPAQSRIGYSVLFSSDHSVVSARDYVVYSDYLRIGRNDEVTVEIRGPTDIQRFVERSNVRIPPGSYSLAVLISDTGSPEDSPFIYRQANDDLFFYAGTAPDAAFEVHIKYSGKDRLDAANPLKVFIGDRTQFRGSGEWAEFKVTREGTYFFPVDDVPRLDNDESGYFIIFIHDVGDNLQGPRRVDPGDVAGLYKEVADNVVYGAFKPTAGTPIYPGGRYSIRFSLPPLPSPDDFEVDDYKELGTFLDYADLPVRQYHTFHDDGSGDRDSDWFRIALRSGESLTVETFSAGGLWESDTQIDIADADMNFIDSNRDKTREDNYSKLSYVNDTGVDQLFHVLVGPRSEYDNIADFENGEYIVDFRY
jgi:hypothetical protein